MKILKEHLVLNGTKVQKVLECDMGNFNKAYFIIYGKTYTPITFMDFNEMSMALEINVRVWKINNNK